jgi:hypothetical protein
MADFFSTSITLKVVEYVLIISDRGKIDLSGLSMHLKGFAAHDYELQLSSEERFSEVPFDLALIDAACTPGKNKPIEKGIGIIEYVMSPSTEIRGWCRLQRAHYEDIWQQISRGAFTSCDLVLDIAPVPTLGPAPVWDVARKPIMYVLGASIRFTHCR